MALIYRPKIFQQFTNVRAAMSLRNPSDPSGFSMKASETVAENVANKNREALLSSLGFSPDQLAIQSQVHGDTVSIVDKSYIADCSDALVCADQNRILAVSVADCIPILIYDSDNQIVAAIHSGWRGSQQNIVGKTIEVIKEKFECKAKNMFVYVGAAASQCCYEVGREVAMQFDMMYSRAASDDKYWFDNKGVVLRQLLDKGVEAQHIDVDTRCTICDPTMHSYRRDGLSSGRMFAVIGRTL